LHLPFEYVPFPIASFAAGKKLMPKQRRIALLRPSDLRKGSKDASRLVRTGRSRVPQISIFTEFMNDENR
jgi:hypothetical protein